MSAMLTHEQLEEQIIEYLRLMHWVAFRTHYGASYKPIIPGWPDIVAFKDGSTMFVEVKVGRDKVKPKQAAIALLLRSAGICVIEARQLEDVLEVGKL
jgi:Holliday junction resolvase